MDLEYMDCEVQGMRWQFPVGRIKIRWRPPADSLMVAVRVDYASRDIVGEITRENMNKLIEFGERTNTKVWTGEDDFAQMIDFIQDIKYGEPKDTDDEVMKSLREKCDRSHKSLLLYP